MKNGLILVYKGKGNTSRDVVEKFLRNMKQKQDI